VFDRAGSARGIFVALKGIWLNLSARGSKDVRPLGGIKKGRKKWTPRAILGGQIARFQEGGLGGGEEKSNGTAVGKTPPSGKEGGGPKACQRMVGSKTKT